MTTAETLIAVAQYYCLAGAGVAALFLVVGIDRIDEDARGAYAFRPLLIPAVLMIWPLVVWRWLREETGAAKWANRYTPPSRASHLIAAVLMSIVIVLALITGFAIRQSWPADAQPVQLEAPQ